MSQIHATIFCGTEHRKDGPYWTQTEAENRIAEVERYATLKCGGCTITRTTGAWAHENGDVNEVIRERAVRFDVLCAYRREARDIAYKAKDVFQQYSVLLEMQEVESEFV